MAHVVAELGVGELRHTSDFDLYDSIAALELMDPKMVSSCELWQLI